MTTDNQTPRPAAGSAEAFRDLTMPQVIMLRTAVEDGYIPTSFLGSQSDDKWNAVSDLINLGLLKISLDHFAIPTAKGRALLAQASANATEAGGEVACLVCGEPSGTALCADCEQLSKQTAERPTTITASEFVSEGYAAKIERGECVVMFGDEEVIDAEEFHLNKKKVQLWYDTEHVFGMFCWADEPLQVEWLTPPAESAPETVAEVAELQSAGESLHSQYLTEKDRYQALYRDYMELHDMHESDTSFVIDTHERLFGIHPVNNEDGSTITFDETVEHWERETVNLRSDLKAAREQQARLLAALEDAKNEIVVLRNRMTTHEEAVADEVIRKAKAKAASAVAAESGKVAK